MPSYTVDMTGGTYRRIYSGFIWGERICGLSRDAECWFWRTHQTADDFGNLSANPKRVWSETCGLRHDVTLEQVTDWLRQMEEAKLILRYTVGGHDFYHVAGWARRQAKGTNGKQAKKFPMHPEWMDEEPVDPGEPKRIQIEPRESRLNQENPDSTGAKTTRSGSGSGSGSEPRSQSASGERESESGETPASSNAQPPTGTPLAVAVATPPCHPSPSGGAVARPEGAERSGGIVGQNRKPMSAAERYNARNEANETPGFLAWWAEYPSMRRTDKVQCHDAWHAQKCEPIADKVLQNLRRWKSSWEAPKFAPSALKFLTARHFEAEPDLPAGQSVADPGADADRERAWAEFQAMDETARNETLVRAWKIAPGLRDKPIDAPGMKGAVAMAMRKVAV